MITKILLFTYLIISLGFLIGNPPPKIITDNNAISLPLSLEKSPLITKIIIKSINTEDFIQHSKDWYSYSVTKENHLILAEHIRVESGVSWVPFLKIENATTLLIEISYKNKTMTISRQKYQSFKTI